MSKKSYYSYPQDREASRTNSPLISVIVPIFNVEKYLGQALDSIEGQTYRNLEIICLNDGSTDDSLAIIQEHASQDERIVVVNKANEGYGASCNKGIDLAHGEWISIIEPDDWIEPTMYQEMMEYASRFPTKADIIKSPYWRIENADTDEQKKLHCSYALKMRKVNRPFRIEDAPCLIRHHPSIWSAIYRKSFLEENGIRFHPIPGAGWADNPFLIDTLCRAKSILYVDNAFYCYRADSEEKERDFHRKNPSVPIQRWLEMTDIMESLGIDDPDVLKAHYERGFMYIGGVLESRSVSEPDIKALAKQAFARMKPDIVFEDNGISPASKRLYADLLGIQAKNAHMAPHAVYLAQQAAYNIRNVGPQELANSIKRYLTKYRLRSGQKQPDTKGKESGR